MKSRFFSLLEMIGVLMLLTVLSSVFALSFLRSSKEQRALNAATTVLDMLNASEHMMQYLSIDSEVHFSIGNDRKISAHRIHRGTTIPKGFEALFGPLHVLDGIESILHVTRNSLPQTLPLCFSYVSHGAKAPEGLLILQFGGWRPDMIISFPACQAPLTFGPTSYFEGDSDLRFPKEMLHE